jgi:hypothetical protein
MYKLFTQIHEENNSIIKPVMLDYILKTYERQVNQVVEYRRSSVSTVKSNHLLCRILLTGGVPYEYSVDRFMSAAYARSPFVSKYFKLTSSLEFGSIHQNVFLGPFSKEIIFYDESYFNPFEENFNWKNAKAVKALYLEDSSMSMSLLDGNKHSTTESFGVFSINIPLLLFQFRFFQIEQIANSISSQEGVNLDISHFVKMYVLPNMLYDKIEHMMLNRFMNLFYGRPMDEQLTNLPIAASLTDYRDKLDRELKTLIKHVQKSKKMYYSILKNIPCVFHKDMQSFLQMPEHVQTRQVWWALYVSRIKIMKFLIDIGGEQALSSNSFYISAMKTDIKRLLSENVLEKSLDGDMYYDILSIFREVLSLR